MKRVWFVARATCVLLVLSERNAYAYVDPGSGSMLLQVLLGGAAGIAVAVRIYWQRVRTFFGSRDKTRDT